MYKFLQATSKFSTNTSLRILSSDKKCLYCPCTQFYKHDSTLPKVRYISSIDSKSLAKGESILEKLISKIPFINPEKNVSMIQNFINLMFSVYNALC